MMNKFLSSCVTVKSSVVPICRNIPVITNPCQILTCPQNITVPNDPGQCGATVNYPNPTVPDNCPGVTITCTPPSGSFFPVGTTNVICTAVDAAGNIATCTFSITVQDVEPPQITCPADRILITTQCEDIVGYPDPIVFDNCPGVTFSCSPPSGSTFPLGTTTVTCTATDVAGNLASCTFAVTVRETLPPVIACPQDIIVPNDPGLCGANVLYPNPLIFENCPGVTFACSPPSGSFFPVGTNAVTCIATDASDNTSSCSFAITVIDTEPPKITCPDITVPSDFNACGAIVEYIPILSDNCGFVSFTCDPPSGEFFDVGTTTVTCIANDLAGNIASCTFTITVQDIVPPQISCPEDITVFSDTPTTVDYPNPFVLDNCGFSFSCTPPPGSIFPLGTTIVTCTATDDSGNISSCTFAITVENEL
ncbi:HYR domain-containing protein [Desulfotomaculum defluvii]